MVIETKFFGDMEIKDEEIIDFQDGLLGFEDAKGYVLINMAQDEIFKCLQSIDRKEVAFIVINPWDAFKDYDIDVNDGEIESFRDKDVKNFAVYTILTITEERMTANLIGPVIINIKTRQGKQIVLHKSCYTTKHIIKEFAGKV